MSVAIEVGDPGGGRLGVIDRIKHRRGKIAATGVEEDAHVIQHPVARGQIVEAIAIEVAGGQRVELHGLTVDGDLTFGEAAGPIAKEKAETATAGAGQMVDHRQIGDGITVEVALHQVQGAVANGDDGPGHQRAIAGIGVHPHLIAAAAGHHDVEPGITIGIDQLHIPGIDAAGIGHRGTEGTIAIARQHRQLGGVVQGDDRLLMPVAIQIEQLQSPRTIAGGGGAGRAEGAVVAAGRADADRRGLDEAVVVAAFQHETRHGGDVEQAGVHRGERVGELVG